MRHPKLIIAGIGVALAAAGGRIGRQAHGGPRHPWRQVAYNGHRLYTFIGDRPGQATGQGVQGFLVATPGIVPVAASATSTGTVPAAPSGSGYGGY